MKLNKLNCPKCRKNTISYACSKGAGATCFYFCNDPSCGILITAGPASNISGWEGGDNKDFEIEEKKEEINKNTEEIKKELKEFDKDKQDEILEMAKGEKKKIKQEKQSAGGKNTILAKIKNDKSLIKDKTETILDIVKCKQCGKNTIKFLSEKSLISKMDTGWQEAKTLYCCENCKSLITIGPAWSSSLLQIPFEMAGKAVGKTMDLIPGGRYAKVALGLIILSKAVKPDNRLNGLMCPKCKSETIDIMSSAGAGATAFYYCNDSDCGILIGTAPSASWTRENRGKISSINGKQSITGKIIEKRSRNFENKSKTILKELSCFRCTKKNIKSEGYSGVLGRLSVAGTSSQTQYYCGSCKSLLSIGPAASLGGWLGFGGSKKKKKTFKKKRKYKRTNKRTKRIKKNKKTKRKKDN